MASHAAKAIYDSEVVRCYLVSDVMVYIALHTGDPPETTWQGYLQVARQHAAKLHGLVVVAQSSTLSAKQRESLRATFAQSRVHTAVMTDSMLTRGTLTALRWYGVPIAGFTPGTYLEALRWMGREELHESVEAVTRKVLGAARRG